MGLDCTAYSNAIYLPDHGPELTEDDGRVIEAWAYRGFERSTRGLVNHDKVTDASFASDIIAHGFYDVSNSETFGFRAGVCGVLGGHHRPPFACVAIHSSTMVRWNRTRRPTRSSPGIRPPSISRLM